MKKHYFWIDNCKALAIFFIVLGHAINNNENILWKWVYGFHVPMFIVLSGLANSYSSVANKKTKIIKLIKRIMIPYYLISVISILIYLILGKFINGYKLLTIEQCVIGMLYGNGENGLMKWNLPLWYLPMIFVTNLISLFLLKKNSIIYDLKCLFTSIAIGSLVYIFKISNLPFGFETSLQLFPFWIFGRIIYDLLNKFKNSKRISIAVLLIIAGTIGILNQGNIDYVSDQYRNYFIFISSAVSVICGFLFIFIWKYDKKEIFVSATGKKSLSILLLHKFPLLFFIQVFSVTKKLYIEHITITSLIISVISIFLCMLLDKLIPSKIRWLIGG